MSKILLVDDEPNILLTVQMCLEAEGYEVITAENGLQAIEMAFSEKPDLILLDVRIPKLNGFLVCKALKEDIKTRDIPVVFLSAKSEENDIKKGKELGALDYLLKPIEPEELLSQVKIYLEREKEEK